MQQKRLRDTAAKQVVDDEKQLPQSAKAAGAAKDGNALVNVGFAYVSAGQFDTGIPLMEQGIAKGGLRQPDEAKLHLGIAYLAAGQKANAVQTFKDVGGADGTADLARLWLIHAQRPRARASTRRVVAADRAAPVDPMRFLLKALTRMPLPVLYALGTFIHVDRVPRRPLAARPGGERHRARVSRQDAPPSARASCGSPIATSPTS